MEKVYSAFFSGVPQHQVLVLSNYADDTNLYTIGENHNTNRNILNKYFLSLQA